MFNLKRCLKVLIFALSLIFQNNMATAQGANYEICNASNMDVSARLVFSTGIGILTNHWSFRHRTDLKQGQCKQLFSTSQDGYLRGDAARIFINFREIYTDGTLGGPVLVRKGEFSSTNNNAVWSGESYCGSRNVNGQAQDFTGTLQDMKAKDDCYTSPYLISWQGVGHLNAQTPHRLTLTANRTRPDELEESGFFSRKIYHICHRELALLKPSKTMSFLIKSVEKLDKKLKAKLYGDCGKSDNGKVVFTDYQYIYPSDEETPC